MHDTVALLRAAADLTRLVDALDARVTPLRDDLAVQALKENVIKRGEIETIGNFGSYEPFRQLARSHGIEPRRGPRPTKYSPYPAVHALAETIAADLDAGALTGTLPAPRDLAQHYDAALRTTRSALRALAGAGRLSTPGDDGTTRVLPVSRQDSPLTEDFRTALTEIHTRATELITRLEELTTTYAAPESESGSATSR